MTHEYVNMKQIARRVRRSPRTVLSWRYRGWGHLPFPPPVLNRSHRGHLVWDWAVVEPWWEHVESLRLTRQSGIARKQAA